MSLALLLTTNSLKCRIKQFAPGDAKDDMVALFPCLFMQWMTAGFSITTLG